MNSDLSRRKLMIGAGALAIAPPLLTFWSNSDEADQAEFAGITMGTTWKVTIARPKEEAKLEALVSRIEGILSSIDARMSTWRRDSEVSRIARRAAGAPMTISSETSTVISAALRTSPLSRGAFDPTIRPAVRLWGFGPDGAVDGVPEDGAVRNALAHTGAHHLRLSSNLGRVSKDASELEIDLSGIAKGFAVDEVSRYLVRPAMALPPRTNRGAAMGKVRRPRYLLSGLLSCGVCGGGMSTISQRHVGCSSARNKGTCDNRRTIARHEIETRVLGALGDRLMEPELFAVFCEEFTAEMNRLRGAVADQAAGLDRELAKIGRDLDRLVQALIDGVPADAVKARMAALEARKAELEARRGCRAAPPPMLHPSMAEIYRQKVSDLAAALDTSGTRTEAAEILRGLIETIVLTPGPDGYAILVRGDLAGILTLAEARRATTAVVCGPSAVGQVSLVAGAGFGQERTWPELQMAV